MENPKISIRQLNAIEEAVDNNTADAADYQLLDNYYAFVGLPNYLLNKLRKEGISGFEEFIYKRRTSPRSDLIGLVGTVLGTISVLKDYITGNL